VVERICCNDNRDLYDSSGIYPEEFMTGMVSSLFPVDTRYRTDIDGVFLDIIL
jgi:hypothetical protein